MNPRAVAAEGANRSGAGKVARGVGGRGRRFSSLLTRVVIEPRSFGGGRPVLAFAASRMG